LGLKLPFLAVQETTPDGIENNANTDDSYEDGEKVKSPVDWEIWIKQDDGRWTNGKETKSYDEL
jgi:hypothetical protein